MYKRLGRSRTIDSSLRTCDIYLESHLILHISRRARNHNGFMLAWVLYSVSNDKAEKLAQTIAGLFRPKSGGVRDTLY